MGRPALYSDEENGIAGLFPEIATRRGLQNRVLALRALASLRSEWQPTFAWFMSLEPMGEQEASAMMMGRSGGVLRFDVLTELGRVDDESERVTLASKVVARAPRTGRDAVAFVRQARIGRPAGNADGLSGVLVAAYNAYVRTHSIDAEEVSSAVDSFDMVVRDSLQSVSEAASETKASKSVKGRK